MVPTFRLQRSKNNSKERAVLFVADQFGHVVHCTLQYIQDGGLGLCGGCCAVFRVGIVAQVGQ